MFFVYFNGEASKDFRLIKGNKDVISIETKKQPASLKYKGASCCIKMRLLITDER